MIAVTGATGKLGILIVKELLKSINPDQIVAGVRDIAKADELIKLGVQLRVLDYNKPETLMSGLKGIDQLVLISSSEFGRRFEQHKEVIAAAKYNKVNHVVYTSVLRADTTVLGLAKDHYQTEIELKKSGLNYTILRNGWYLENHTENMQSALSHGIILGAAQNGQFSSASRLDYAKAAVVVLTQPGHLNKTYELAGDHSFTLQDFANELAKQSGKNIIYKNMNKDEYEQVLISYGVPYPLAQLLADSDQGASSGALYAEKSDLKHLTQEPARTLSEAIRLAL